MMCICGYCGGACVLLIPFAWFGFHWARGWLDRHRHFDREELNDGET